MKPIILIDDEKAKELALAGAEVLTHSITGDQLAVRSPTRAQWKKFRQAVTSGIPDKAELASEALIYDCLVFPEKGQVSSYFEARPAAADVFAKGLATLAGFGGEAEKKD